MSHVLSLAAGTLPEFAPDVIADAAGSAGFSHVGFTIEPELWTAELARETAKQVAAWNLSVLDVEVAWIPEGGQLNDGHRTIIEAGAALGAANVLVVSSEPDRQRTAEAMHRLCEWAEPAAMRVALEFLMITPVQTLNAALEIVESCDHPLAAILIDTLHFQRAGHQPADLRSISPLLLPYAQFCDGNADCLDEFDSYLEDAIDLRSLPGEGELPLESMLAALPPAIPLSLEIRSKAVRDRYPDPRERAAAVKANADTLLAESNRQ
jgi:sugar phosphate isomerase/epimerase